MSSEHSLKAGAEYRDNGADISLRFSYLQRQSDSNYFLHKNGDQSVVHNRLPSLFLQDSWHVSGALTLNAGLRWDGQYLIGSDGRVHQRILGQFQPRLGFLVLPDENAFDQWMKRRDHSLALVSGSSEPIDWDLLRRIARHLERTVFLARRLQS